MVANKGYVDPAACSYMALVANKELVDSGEIIVVADLEGRALLNLSNNFYGYMMSKMLEAEGLTLQDVELTDIRDSVARMEAVTQGAADAAFFVEPHLTRLTDSGAASVILNDKDIVPNASFGFLIFGNFLLEENPEAGQQFMMGYLEGVHQYNEGKTERNIALLSQVTGLEADLLERACWPPVTDDLSIDTEYIMDFQDWAVKQELLDSVVPEDAFLDTRFMNFANDNLP